MERSPVSSSNVESVGYDEDSETLEVEFKNGTLYQYFDVPQSAFSGLVNADSVGSYLAENIKGVYRYSRV
ncbi:KTSC domain-containing protein [Pseudomonas rhodesiae]|uniref:KTSC domain-containing protein n=1 Tax=Pseudomonas rhodesiae TaxID=76760 RepID=UPI000B8BF781|nr:KTSC domain-containing protein [Pseudomonas rhodesiae]OXS19624.1 KTSC domain-containing protein [Pseudomonas fluorescens]OZO46602.1 KTSC domain-containing protein [Pseudomonas fluorescens]TGY15644.1 KTSC domain-containing protein [Pseudomonas fluorescens]WLG37839.1 KTSC domain-containing protein [Pseudomonas rhodesiae]